MSDDRLSNVIPFPGITPREREIENERIRTASVAAVTDVERLIRKARFYAKHHEWDDVRRARRSLGEASEEFERFFGGPTGPDRRRLDARGDGSGRRGAAESRLRYRLVPQRVEALLAPVVIDIAPPRPTVRRRLPTTAVAVRLSRGRCR